ncbi:MAG: hypothetical protein [Wendovervirus sonii]|uniref:Uncharacterized protein n=1 Tax=phage Lak_Megaphage_Sonny TaxID=3109229 RepID=A0ABZ0Z5I0_9CAUD|nr:MAG: hypothetical protein [phage Lak_Megaphage_Sonny]
MKTYLMTIDSKPLAYVFDEDTTISYVMADKDNLADYFSKIFSEKQKMCNAISAKMDFVHAGFSAQMELLNICMQKNSYDLLIYLKKWREQYRNINAGLKSKEGIVQNIYNSSNRMTKDSAIKEINQINRCF